MDRRYVAEAIGPFALVFAGTSAIVINDITSGAISHVGIALPFGFVVAAMIYAIGDISGAHFNPARSLAPAIFAAQLEYLWLYLVAPVLGAGIAVIGCRCARGQSCCT